MYGHAGVLISSIPLARYGKEAMTLDSLIITSTELAYLSSYAATQPKIRTYRIRRDEAHRLYIHEPNGTRTFLIPEMVEPGTLDPRD